MAGIKSLAKDTAVYGMSSIVGRFLNWCLVPMYTHVFPTEEYGIVTLVYSIVALLLVCLIYGMETGFFRFANHERWKNPMQVYTTALTSLSVTSTIFLFITLIFSGLFSKMIGCPGHPSYIWMMGVAVAIDAFTSLPFAYLRYKHKAIRFATLKLIGIGLNIGLNIFFILVLPLLASSGYLGWMWSADFGVGYIFLANMISSVVTLFLLLPELKLKWTYCGTLLREMLVYSFPLLVLGLAGIMNQSIDKILYPLLVSDRSVAMDGLGIYGANYKIAIIMVMFIQAFRFAYEPYIFSQHKKADGTRSNEAYVQAMKWYVIFAMLIFLGVMEMIDIVKWFVAPEYFSGLRVVPIIMIAEFFFGVFFNLSVWYKITDRTVYGTWFSLLGLAVTLIMNIVLVPKMGYMGCAVAALCCYGTMMIISWIVGQRKYPIDYDMQSAFLYFTAGVGLWILTAAIQKYMEMPSYVLWGIRILSICAYIWVVAVKEKLLMKTRILKK